LPKNSVIRVRPRGVAGAVVSSWPRGQQQRDRFRRVDDSGGQQSVPLVHVHRDDRALADDPVAGGRQVDVPRSRAADRPNANREERCSAAGIRSNNRFRISVRLGGSADAAGVKDVRYVDAWWSATAGRGCSECALVPVNRYR
jgi:hypothetical protein